MVYYSYNEFINDLKELLKQIDFEFDCILAVSRGGLTIGHFLANYYNTKNIFTVTTSYYDEKSRLDSVDVSNIPNLEQFQNILIVDEIVDTGHSAKELMNRLNSVYQDKTFKFLSIFAKDDAVFQPDFYIKKADKWIEFFWEVDLAQ